MDDTNPDPQLDDIDAAGPPPDAPDETLAPSPADDSAGSGRFAVYDKDELRFRGRVHETRKGADTFKSELGKPKGVRRGRFEVREV